MFTLVNNTHVTPTIFLAHSARRERTFAGLEALKPSVIEVRVARISAVLGPRAAGSATTAYSGLLDGAALGACGTYYWFGRERIITLIDLTRFNEFAFFVPPNVSYHGAHAGLSPPTAVVVSAHAIATPLLFFACLFRLLLFPPFQAQFLRLITPDISHSTFSRWIAVAYLPSPPRSHALDAGVWYAWLTCGYWRHTQKEGHIHTHTHTDAEIALPCMRQAGMCALSLPLQAWRPSDHV